MNKPTVRINGDNFSDLDGFFDEIERVLTKDLGWRTGRNLNAFNDLLRGGFGIHEYEEPVKIVWTHFSDSRNKLGGELIDRIVEIIASHPHVEFETEIDFNPT